MKILIATGIYPPDIGGPATYSKLLKDELPKRGIEVKVLSFGEVRHLPKIIRHFVYFAKLIKRSRGCGIIYAQDPVSVGLPSFLASKFTGKSFFLRVAGDYAWEQAVQRHGVTDSVDEFQKKRYGLKTEFLRSIQKFVVKRADTVITPSIYFKNLVAGWSGRQKKIFHIYNGIEFPELNISKAEARNRLSMPKDSFTIVSAGRLVPWKGFPALMDAVGILNRESSRGTSSYKLYILGDGPDRSTLEKYISSKGLKEVVFLKGSVTRAEVFSYLIAADVFVLNTSFESFSFQIVEAMYAGVPVISTNIGNIGEIIENHKSGILLSPNDVGAIVESVREIENNNSLKESFIKNAKEKSKNFSIQNTLDSLCELLRGNNKIKP